MLLYLHTLIVLVVAVAARQHHLFVGTYGSSSIYGVTYDDVTRTLTQVKNNTTRVENEWLALSYDGKTLYSSGVNGWSSFPVTSPTTIGAESGRTPNVGECSVWQGVYIFASRREPYTVYGTLSCANYVNVDKTGNVDKAAQVPYNEAVVIYGMAMDPSNQYLYSSDWKNGKIWTHRVEVDGSLTSLGSVEGPSNVSAPRTMVVHPSGKTMYVLLEGWNAVALYTIDATTHMPVYTGGTYPLLPDSKLSSMPLSTKR
jgi:carboxy-cis,cis-muconate cyclase